MELLRNERVGDGTFDLVWPRHRSHYLNPSLQDLETDMIDDGMSSLPVSTPGRDLAARALLAATDCTQQRVSELLETSRRRIGRAADTDLTSALQDAAVVAEARSIVAHTARCGSTEHERQAADTWLTEAQHEQRPVETSPRRVATVRRKKPVAKPATPSKNGIPRTAAAPVLPQIDALERQQHRILHRSGLISYVLATEQQNGQRLTMGEALAELLADITEAARTSVTILQQATRPSSHR